MTLAQRIADARRLLEGGADESTADVWDPEKETHNPGWKRPEPAKKNGGKNGNGKKKPPGGMDAFLKMLKCPPGKIAKSVFGRPACVGERMQDLLGETIQVPNTPKGRAAYLRSLIGWSGSAARVASSYSSKAGEMSGAAEPGSPEQSLEQALWDLSVRLSEVAKRADALGK